MLDSGAPLGSRPVKVAPVTSASWPRMKSSAVSVSSDPEPAGADKVAILPSGLPVLNNNVAAPDGSINETAHAIRLSVFFTTVPPIPSTPIRSILSVRRQFNRVKAWGGQMNFCGADYQAFESAG